MTGMTRRSLLGASVLAAVGVATGCSSSDKTTSAGGGGTTGTLDWWDHFSSFKHLNDDWAKSQSGSLKTNVTHTYYPAGHMMYHDPASRRQLHDDVANFIRGAAGAADARE